MDYGKLLVSRVLQEQNIAPVADRGLEPSMMPDPDSSAALKFVIDFFKQHRKVPSVLLVEQQFPNYKLQTASDPISFYADKILAQYVRHQAGEVVLEEAKRLGTTDPFTVAMAVRTKLNKLLSLGKGNRLKDILDNPDERAIAFEDRKNRVGLLGIKTPWSSMDDITLGWQPEMYFGFAGRPGTGKTWVMLIIGIVAWLDGYDVMFCNKELPDSLMEQRFDAWNAKLAYERFRTGMLTTAEEQRFKLWISDLKAGKHTAKWTWIHEVKTVGGIAAQVEALQPDLVLIDGVYLLMDENNAKVRHEKFENISRAVKSMAQDYKVPVGISIQLSRTGDLKKNKNTALTQSDVIGSDAFAQDVDYLFGLEQTDEMRDNNEMKLHPLKAREAKPTPILVGWDLENMESVDHGQTTTVIEKADDEGSVTY